MVEPSAFAIKAAPASKRTKKTTAERAAIKDYAKSHGLHRGGQDRCDDPPNGAQPELNLEAEDEGLSVLIQSTICRRRIWALAFDCDPEVLGERY